MLTLTLAHRCTALEIEASKASKLEAINVVLLKD